MLDAHLEGRAAHAGLEPEKGINATLALAALVPLVAATADSAAGTTVTPTIAVSGVTRNTVPAAATFAIDVRAATVVELNRVRAELATLGPRAAGAQVRIEELGWRPPLEPRMSAGLWAEYVAVCADLGVPQPDAVTVGGGSDGNFTAAVGTPTLDGLGAVGEGAHAEGERILLQPTLQATTVLTGLIDRLLR